MSSLLDYNMYVPDAAYFYKPTNSTYTTLSAWQAGTLQLNNPQDVHSMASPSADFVSPAPVEILDFTVLKSSQAVNAGIPSERVVKDIGLRTRLGGGPPDIGAWEQDAADLSLVMDANPATAYVGEEIAYSVAITNLGPSNATGVTLNSQLADGLLLDSVSSSHGDCTGDGMVACSLGDIPVGTSASVNMLLTPLVAGTLVNTANVAGAEPDGNLASNQATLSLSIVPAADLSVSISGAPGSVIQGEEVVYHVSVTNNGPNTANGIVLTGLLGCDLPGNTLASGASMSCSASDVAETAGSLSQAVTVNGDELDPDLSNNTAGTTTNVQALLTVSKSGTGVGTVDSIPEGITCGASCIAAFDGNANVILNAVAANDSTFAGWSGCATNPDSTCTVTMDASKTLTATFALNTYGLTMNTAGTGTGTLTEGGTYNYGTNVTVTATPSLGSGFDGWTGPDAAECETGSIAMTDDKSCTATFTLLTFSNPSAQAAQAGGDGNGYQTNPINAYAYDTAVAVDTNSGTNTNTSCTNSGKDKHQFYNYGFTLPTGVVVKGIEVSLNAKVDNTKGSPMICVQLSSDGGSTWTAAQTTATLTTALTDYTLGGPADTWGGAWSVTNLSNANFRLRVINVASNTSRDFSLNNAAVRVTY